jgi:hypothetical protein
MSIAHRYRQRKWPAPTSPSCRPTEGGEIANRPMSNNGDASYDGAPYYLTYEQARAVSEIRRDPKVALGISSEGGMSPTVSTLQSKVPPDL